eukprot:RCo026755
MGCPCSHQRPVESDPLQPQPSAPPAQLCAIPQTPKTLNSFASESEYEAYLKDVLKPGTKVMAVAGDRKGDHGVYLGTNNYVLPCHVQWEGFGKPRWVRWTDVELDPSEEVEPSAKPKWSNGMKALIPSWEALQGQTCSTVPAMRAYCDQIGEVSEVGPVICRVTFRDKKWWKYDLDRLLDPAEALPKAKVGDSVTRGPDWKWGNQDGGVGNKGRVVGDAGWLTVQWDEGGTANYRCGAEGCHDLRVASADSNASQVKIGDIVVRGPDWKWGNQDGGAGKKGLVIGTPGWLTVQWDEGGGLYMYRCGAEGCYDLRVVTSCSLQLTKIETKLPRALVEVDRAHFCPDSLKTKARESGDPSLKHGHFNLSPILFYRLALRGLKLAPSREGSQPLRILNVGSGSGYFSAVMAAAAGPGSVNHGIEVHADLVEWAKLKTGSLPAVKACSFEFLVGSVLGLDPGPVKKAYDRIFLGAGIRPCHTELFLAMLRKNGILVAPVDSQLVALEKDSSGAIWTQVLGSGTFPALDTTPPLMTTLRFASGDHVCREAWPPKPLATDTFALLQTRLDTEVAAKVGGPHLLGALRYDDALPDGLTCESVFRSYHSLRGVPQDDMEALLVVVKDKLSDPVVKDLMAAHELSQDEGFAIAWFASDLSLANPAQAASNAWRVANELLGKCKMEELKELQLEPWLRFLLKGLMKLPVWQGKTYRGFRDSLETLSEIYVHGSTATWTTVSSTTVDQAGTMRRRVGRCGGTIVQLEVTEARDISMFCCGGESEVVLLPNSTFTVEQALPHQHAVQLLELFAVSTDDLPGNTDVIVLKQTETPALGKFLQPRKAP